MMLSLEEKQTIIYLLECKLFEYGNDNKNEKEIQNILLIIKKIENSIPTK